MRPRRAPKVDPRASHAQTTIGDVVFARAANDGLAVGAMSVTGSAGRVTVTLTPSKLPDGWTIESAFGAAAEQQQPDA